MNAASLTSPGPCTRYASAKPDPAGDVGRSAVSSGVYRSAPGLMPTTLHAPVIGCLRPLSTILRSPGWGASTPESGTYATRVTFIGFFTAPRTHVNHLYRLRGMVFVPGNVGAGE